MSDSKQSSLDRWHTIQINDRSHAQRLALRLIQAGYSFRYITQRPRSGYLFMFSTAIDFQRHWQLFDRVPYTPVANPHEDIS